MRASRRTSRKSISVCGELIEAAERAGARVIACPSMASRPCQLPSISTALCARRASFAFAKNWGVSCSMPARAGAFAVADHQIAHVYVADPARFPQVKTLVESLPGVERVLDEAGKRECGLDHPRSGELVAIARADSWFTYYYFLDDERAPDFARTVDIHRKPGYDPVELFIDPQLRLPRRASRGGWRRRCSASAI